MNQGTKKLRRRDFLTGAAALGASVVAGLPAMASAQVSIGGGSRTPPPQLFYWTGTQFIPATQVVPNVVVDTVNVHIRAFGTSASVATIDVQMPGGPFMAFTSQPQGSGDAQFSAPVKTPLGLTLNVGSPTSKSVLTILPIANPGPRLAVGTYLLVDAGVKAAGFILIDSDTAPVLYAYGTPVSIPYTLITITDA